MIPGEPLPTEGDVELNENRQTASLTVANTGDRPIQVGSHFHFFETNKALRFDRESAFGMRLDVPAGSSVRFEPGDEREGHFPSRRRYLPGVPAASSDPLRQF